MSSRAIARRFGILVELHRLSMALSRAKLLGKARILR
jgi:hypothetical protein